MSEKIIKRLRKDRPMVSISIRFPEDVLEDLKEVAPAMGFSGYQPLIRAYIGQGLRKDLARLGNDPLRRLADSLRQQGVADAIIAEAVRAALAVRESYPAGTSAFLERVCEPPADPYGPEDGDSSQ